MRKYYSKGMSVKGDNKRDIRKVESMIGSSKSSKREKGRTKKMGGGLMKRPMMKEGGSLKPVQPNQKGLKKLPTKVRNKMGYMKKGGRVGMGKAMRGGGCVR